MKSGLNRFSIKLLILLFVTVPGSSLFAGDSLDRILLLFSYHSGHEWEDSIYVTLIDQLKELTPGAEIYLEYMDTKRMDPAVQFSDFHFHLKKFSQDWFSLIIAVDDNALRYLSETGKDLFPGTPIVFCGVNGYEGMKSSLPEEVSGVVSRVNLADTIKLARSLIPDLKTVHVLADATPTGDGNRQMIRDQLSGFQGELSDLAFHFVQGDEYSTQEMLEWTSRLEKGSILLMTSWYRDRAGVYIGEKALIKQLDKYSSVPVFNLLHVRPGLLGGKVTSGRIQAELVSDMAARILGGTAASSIPVILEDTSHYVIDYKRLRHWGFSVSRLPENTLILNPSLLYRYRVEALILLLIFVILLLLLFALGYSSFQLKRAGWQMTQQKNELFITLSSIGDAVISTDSQSRIIFMNRIAENLTGWNLKEAQGVPLDVVFCIHNVISGKKIDSPVSQVLQSGKIVELANHTVLTAKDGRQYQISDSAAPIRDSPDDSIHGVVLVFRDVSELSETREALRISREQLRQAARMEALGKMAGGISHEYSNLLQIIMGYAQLLKEEYGGSPAESLIEPILKTSINARKLTRQLLLFSRNEHSEKKVLSLSVLIRTISPILKSLLEENIRLKTDLEGKEDWSLCDRQQIEQVLINLALNARDAMPGGGSLQISQSILESPVGFSGLTGEIPAGTYVHITVEDTGVGISREILPEIFDPFFSTKETDKGTGLGLSIVFGIVTEHNGYLHVDTDRERGSAFHVYLPRVFPVEEREEKRSDKKMISPGSGGLILIAEDDPIVRQLMEKTVESFGYHSRSFHNGRELLDQLKAGALHNEVSLFFLDVVMPEMGGVEAYNIIRDMGYKTPVLFCSGYTGDKLISTDSMENAGLIRKPFTSNELEKTLKEIIC